MENQTPNEDTTNGAVTTVQEATSTNTLEKPIQKGGLRTAIWKKFKDEKIIVPSGRSFRIFKRIPIFVGNDEAAAALAETEEFKNAKNIAINYDRALDSVKLQCISAGKNLYLSPYRKWNTLYTKVECASDADEKTKKNALRSIRQLKDQNDENKIAMDLIVVGSVVVSRDGHRIGTGKGWNDLYFGVLIKAGVITPQTLIVTIVHDIQVNDDMPDSVFQKYDMPVDIIVTPTEIIRVSKKLPRPDVIYWDMLYERRVKNNPVLLAIKEIEEKEGKVVTLRPDGPDSAENTRRRPFPRRNRRLPRKDTDTTNENQENVTSRPQNRRPRFPRSRKSKSENEGEQSSNENKEGKVIRKKRNNFCVEVSNITKGVRVKDLKTELRKRGCNPVHISWKAGFGKCRLHFPKRNNKEVETQMDELLESLSNLTVTVQDGDKLESIKLSVDILKPKEEAVTNSELVDTTAV